MYDLGLGEAPDHLSSYTPRDIAATADSSVAFKSREAARVGDGGGGRRVPVPLRGLRYIRQGVMLSRKREGGKVLVSGALEQVVSRPSGRRRPMFQHRNKPFTAAKL